MEIPIIGKPDLGPYPINMFYSQAAHKELNLPGLMGTPGLNEYYDPSYAYPVRGLHVMGDYLYAAIGNRFYKIDSDANGVLLVGTFINTTGPVQIVSDGTYMMLVERGVRGYTSEVDGALTVISDVDFPIPSALTWQDGYFIVCENDSDTFYISTIRDPITWDGNDYTSAESSPDNTLQILSDHKEVLSFGTQTIQAHWHSGNASFPFEAVQGATIQEGIGAGDSVAAGDNVVFFVDKHGRIMRMSGHRVEPISSRYIEDIICNFPYFSDAIGFYYAHQGHGFYVVTFPRGNATWVYDVSTNLWHERTSYPVSPDGSYSRWRANCHALFNGKHIVGDYENGKLYELDFDTYKDNDETIIRVFDLPAIGDGKTKIRHNKLKLDYKTGVGITGTTPTDGVDPQAMLLWSDDGKKTWSNELTHSMGKIGDYDKEVNFRRLGASRRRNYRNVVSAPVEVVITGAKLT